MVKRWDLHFTSRQLYNKVKERYGSSWAKMVALVLKSSDFSLVQRAHRLSVGKGVHQGPAFFVKNHLLSSWIDSKNYENEYDNGITCPIGGA